MKRASVCVGIFMLALGVFSITACWDMVGSSGPRGTYPENAGEVALQLQVGTTTVTSANYTISNDVHTYQGSIWVADASTLLAVIGGIEAGAGYTLALSATGSNGVPCQGVSAPFTVVPNATVVVGIQLICRPSNDAGSVKIEGTIAACATFEAVSAGVPLGNQIQLSATVSPSAPMPPVSLSWVITEGSGTLSSTSAADPVYTCVSSDELVMFDLTIAQAGAPICTSTFHLIINCPPPDPIGSPTDGG